MLRKLLKYELLATGRIFLPLFLALLVFAAITRLLSAISPEKWIIPAIISMAIYVIIMVGMFAMTFIMTIQRFYKNLLTDEGYLMFTLPVRPWKHIVSKLLVSMLWMISSALVAFISILIIAFKQGDLTKFTAGLGSFYHQAFDQFGASLPLVSFEFILGILVSLVSGILIVYASIAIGHLFSRHKMLASFGAFIVLSNLSQILLLLIGLFPGIVYFSKILSSYDLNSIESIAHWLIAFGIIFEGLLCAAYFAITNFILGKRLNLE